MRERRSGIRLWAGPLLLGVVSVVGLTVGLLGGGVADVVSWIALAVPVAVCVWAIWLRSPEDRAG